MYMSCQRQNPILFLDIYCMIQYIGRKLHPYCKRQSADFQKFTFDPSKIHNTHSTTIHVHVMSTPCSNFIPVYLLYDTTIHREKITPLQQTPIRRFPKVYVLKFTTHTLQLSMYMSCRHLQFYSCIPTI